MEIHLYNDLPHTLCGLRCDTGKEYLVGDPSKATCMQCLRVYIDLKNSDALKQSFLASTETHMFDGIYTICGKQRCDNIYVTGTESQVTCEKCKEFILRVKVSNLQKQIRQLEEEFYNNREGDSSIDDGPVEINITLHDGAPYTGKLNRVLFTTADGIDMKPRDKYFFVNYYGEIFPNEAVEGNYENTPNIDCFSKYENAESYAKSIPRKPLFKTADVYEIFPGDEYYVITELSSISKCTGNNHIAYSDNKAKDRFKFEWAAEKELKRRQPLLSFNEVRDIIQDSIFCSGTRRMRIERTYIRKLVRLFRTKAREL